MSEVRITVTRNGSYHIEGEVLLVDHQGNRIPYDGEDFWLCRCGGSQTKPFCDGTHRKIGFKGPIMVPVEPRDVDPTP